MRGSVRLVTDEHGATVATRHYRPWGESRTPYEAKAAAELSAGAKREISLHRLRKADGPAVRLFGFVGERHDDALGLVYLRARWYEPATGRLLGRDPLPGRLFDPQSQHPYLYAEANPITLTDPSGLAASALAPGDGSSGILFRPPQWMIDSASGTLSGMGGYTEWRLEYSDRYTRRGLSLLAEAQRYFDRAAGLWARANAPSSNWVMRLPIMRDIRTGYLSGAARNVWMRGWPQAVRGAELLDKAGNLARPWVRVGGRALPVAGFAFDAFFAGEQEWNHDAGQSEGDRWRHTIVQGAFTGAGSTAVGALAAAGCIATGVGAILVAGCAAVGGYLGGLGGQALGGLANAAIDWALPYLGQAKDEVVDLGGQAIDWAAPRLTHAWDSAIGAGGDMIDGIGNEASHLWSSIF